MKKWSDQIENLKIPYPEKALLAREIQLHVEHFPDQNTELLENEELNELYQIHNTALLKALEGLHPWYRATIEFAFAAAPISALLIYLAEENFMSQFIHEGGPGMFVVLAVGIVLLAREILLVSRVLVIKDHSAKNLSIDTMTVMIGAMALLLLGVTVTGLGAYRSAFNVISQNLPMSILIEGLKESITGLVLSSSLAALTLLLHFFTRRTMTKWKVPETLLD